MKTLFKGKKQHSKYFVDNSLEPQGCLFYLEDITKILEHRPDVTTAVFIDGCITEVMMPYKEFEAIYLKAVHAPPIFGPIEEEEAVEIDALIGKWQAGNRVCASWLKDCQALDEFVSDLKALKASHAKELTANMNEVADLKMGMRALEKDKKHWKQQCESEGQLSYLKDDELKALQSKVEEFEKWFKTQTGFHKRKIQENMPSEADDSIIVNLQKTLLHMVEMCERKFNKIFKD